MSVDRSHAIWQQMKRTAGVLDFLFLADFISPSSLKPPQCAILLMFLPQVYAVFQHVWLFSAFS